MNPSQSNSVFRQGGAPPPWMRRAQRGMFAASVVLGLSFCATIWLSAIDGPAALDRVAIGVFAASNALSVFDQSGTRLVLVACLAVCVLVTWWLERERIDRLEPLILLGLLLVVLASLCGARAARTVYWQHGVVLVRLPQVDAYLVWSAAGATFLLAGLVRVALHGARRGAVIGACGLFIVLFNLWVTHHFLVTPHWAQHGPDFIVQDLPVAPASEMTYFRGSVEKIWSVVELAERNGQVTFFAQGREVDPDQVSEHVKALVPRLQYEDVETKKPRRRPIPLCVRVDATLTAGQVLPFLEQSLELGVGRILMLARKFEPWGCGLIWIEAPEISGRTVLEMHSTESRPGESGILFRFAGLEAKSAQEFFPHLQTHQITRYSDRDRVTLRVEPGASWQEVVTALDGLHTRVRRVSVRLSEW